MKNNHILIDYENVQPEVADVLAQPIFKVWIFVGAQQNKVKFDLVDLLQRKGGDARVIKMTSSGRNALDFHMAFYLGELANKEPSGYFHVITGDGDLDRLLEHLRERGIEAFRHESVLDIAIIKPPSSTPRDEKLSRVIEYLVRRGPQRPASLKTLKGSIGALFQPKLTEAESQTIVDILIEHGILDIQGAKLIYGLPD
jgi:hypothetical protein